MNWLDTLTDMRKRSGMSLDELSKKSRVPKGTLSKITAGITKAPPLETMRSIVYAMGYTLKDLDDGIELSDTLSKKEREHIKKYRALDKHGKEIVDLVLGKEIERVESECRQKPQIDKDGTVTDPLKLGADEFAALAREHYLLEKNLESEASSVKESGAVAG